jgi:hypothetical protein
MNLTSLSADEPASMECILKSELFPKKSLVCEDESLHVPFPLLCGEAVEYLGRTAAGLLIQVSLYIVTIRPRLILDIHLSTKVT